MKEMGLNKKALYTFSRRRTKICLLLLLGLLCFLVFRWYSSSWRSDLKPWTGMVTDFTNVVSKALEKCEKIEQGDTKLKPFAAPKKVFNPSCRMEFMGYKSSKLELYMINHVKEFQGTQGANIRNARKRYCDFMESKYVKSSVEEFLDAMAVYQKLDSFEGVKVNTDIFSTMTYRTRCLDGSIEMNTHYIEPLLGLTRHPYATCKDLSWLERLDYILLQSFKDNLFYKKMKANEQIQFIGIDLGASNWARTAVTNTDWFYTNYEHRGVELDRMLMWEGRDYDQSDIWSFPPKYTSSFQYFNMFADLDPNGAGNPLRVLHKIARKEDFVMVKLDIDQPNEINFLITMLEDPNALAVVDEFFFEHHTVTPVMKKWWKKKVACQVNDTYSIFLELRKSGVRAHGWP